MKKLLVTGGCGFIGSKICLAGLVEGWDVYVIDNLRRAGSERHAEQLKQLGVHVTVADVRDEAAISHQPHFDAMVLAAAEPTVMAGVHSSPTYTIGANLTGTLHCLEHARKCGSAVILLSTSRVYGIESLRSLPYTVEESRFDWRTSRISNVHGFDPQRGISESFSTDGFRSIYGTTKLASELMLTEYHHNYGIQILILRCGLVAGPGQMARSDQGIVTLWVARHLFGQSIKYIGFDGSGRQVRDVMHVEDLVEFVMQRLAEPEHWQAKTYNLGGGMSVSVSLCELSELCRRITGQSIPIESDVKTSMVDIPIYISDTSLAASTFQWQPKRTVEHVVEDISHWILQGDANLWRILGKNA